MMGDHAKGDVLQIIDFLYLHCVLWISKEDLDGGVGIFWIVWHFLSDPDLRRNPSDTSLPSKHKLVWIYLEQFVGKF